MRAHKTQQAAVMQNGAPTCTFVETHVDGIMKCGTTRQAVGGFLMLCEIR